MCVMPNNKTSTTMKRLLYVCAAALLSCNACSTPEGYAIRGNFPGLQDGITVTLRSLEGDMPQILAQDTVQNGQFELRGYTPSPVYCDLTINNKSYGAVSQIALNKGTYLFLDNSEMQMEAPHFDSLAFISPTYSEIENPDVKITGGALQAEYIAYRQALYPYEQKAKMPGDSLSIYFFKYNMQQCPREEYVKKYDYFYPIKANAERHMDSVRMAFIRQHPSSPLSLYLAGKLLNSNFILTQAEVEELAQIGATATDTMRQARILQYAQTARKMYNGASYTDLVLQDPTGKSVKLSQLIPANSYAIIDFWASWCAPCRAAIPTVKEIYDRYGRGQLNVVSVSMDKEQADWEQAMQEENMPWAQAWAGKPEAMNAASRSYNITTIPRLLLISPEGKVIFSTYDAEALRFTIERLIK